MKLIMSVKIDSIVVNTTIQGQTVKLIDAKSIEFSIDTEIDLNDLEKFSELMKENIKAIKSFGGETPNQPSQN